jgi:transposase
MTKMSKKLASSVSISELLAMREQGLTNYQIAERLGVTYRTIVSYIGKQPKGLRAPMGSRKRTKPLTDIEPEEVAENAAGVSRKTFAEMLHEMRTHEATEKFREEHGIEADGETETALPAHGDDATAEASELKRDDIVHVNARGTWYEVPRIVCDVIRNEFAKMYAPAEPAATPAEIAREVYERLGGDDVSSLIEEPAEDAFVHELLAVFGRKTVRNYLKVALYVSGNVFITTPTHVGMLSALRKMNAEVNVGD